VDGALAVEPVLVETLVTASVTRVTADFDALYAQRGLLSVEHIFGLVITRRTPKEW
jgi:hypothetical protein